MSACLSILRIYFFFLCFWMCHFSNIFWHLWLCCLLIVLIRAKSICACAQISARAGEMWRSSGSGCRSHADCPTCGRAAPQHHMCPKVRHVLWSITARSQDNIWKCCSEKTRHGGAWRACRSVFTLPKSWGERRLIQLGWALMSIMAGYGMCLKSFTNERCVLVFEELLQTV